MKVGDKLFLVERSTRVKAPPSTRWVEITKVGRKWMYIDWRDHRFDPEHMRIDGRGYTSPGKLYLTEEDYREDERRHALWQRFHVCLSKRFWPHKGLTSDAILQAADALGIRSEVE